MIVRCGVCRAQFEVPGPGRYACPACGSTNQVAGAAPRPGGYPGSPPTPPYGDQSPAAPPPPPPDPPSPRITCPECEFSFIVGTIAVATCPNCGAEVATGVAPPETPTEAPTAPSDRSSPDPDDSGSQGP